MQPRRPRMWNRSRVAEVPDYAKVPFDDRARADLRPALVRLPLPRCRLLRNQVNGSALSGAGHLRHGYHRTRGVRERRHSALTRDAEDSTGTPMLMARSGYTSVRSLARYAGVSPRRRRAPGPSATRAAGGRKPLRAASRATRAACEPAHATRRAARGRWTPGQPHRPRPRLRPTSPHRAEPGTPARVFLR